MSGDRPPATLASRLFGALAQHEILQLINALFEVLSPELQKRAIARLSDDTQQTIEQILASPPTEQAPATEIVSRERQIQTWEQLWKDWEEIVWEASEENGKYIEQEADWEPPYFDETTFTEDLERVAEKMRPLVQLVFASDVAPEYDFFKALLEVEAEVSGALPDWIELTEGLWLGPQLSFCTLQWEWLSLQQQGEDAFGFVRKIRQYERQFREVALDENSVLDFLAQLPEADRQRILAGLTAEKEVPLWKEKLDKARSIWHLLYLDLTERYAPASYLDKLRETIPQRWQNGLPILEKLLNEKNYKESRIAIEETIVALLKSSHTKIAWTPETALLVAVSGLFSSYRDIEKSAIELLDYYQQTARAFKQAERANALEIQKLAFDRWYDWSKMLAAFAETPLSESTHQALFASWRDYVDRQCRPKPVWIRGRERIKPAETWWLLWLIDGIVDPQKGVRWFQEQVIEWVTHFPENELPLSENYNMLRLLTKDLTEVQREGQPEHPYFYELVIRPQELSTPGQRSRCEYLQQYAPADLLERVTSYWKANLWRFVPRPETAGGSDYTENARWMVALKELSPRDYEKLLASWRTDHKRRKNLWKAMQQVELS